MPSRRSFNGPTTLRPELTMFSNKQSIVRCAFVAAVLLTAISSASAAGIAELEPLPSFFERRCLEHGCFSYIGLLPSEKLCRFCTSMPLIASLTLYPFVGLQAPTEGSSSKTKSSTLWGSSSLEMLMALAEPLHSFPPARMLPALLRLSQMLQVW